MGQPEHQQDRSRDSAGRDREDQPRPVGSSEAGFERSGSNEDEKDPVGTQTAPGPQV